jgi:hypothetical protein
MKVLLLTQTLKRGSIFKTGAFVLFTMCAMLLTGFMNPISAQTFSRTECNCLNNASEPGNGQFSETFFIDSGTGETWTLVSATGFFRPDSPDPPADPLEFAPGTTIMEGPTGVYALTGRRVEGTSWSLTVSNGTNEFTYGSSHLCVYPPEVGIIGQRGICEASSSTYSLPEPLARWQNITWSLSGGGVIVGPTNGTSVNVEWDGVPGAYTLSVSGSYRAFPAQSMNLCDFDYETTIHVLSQFPAAMACRSFTNVTMNASCELYILPEMILEGQNIINDAFEVILRDVERGTVVPSGIIDMAYIDRMLEVRVRHICSGNSCWGFVLLEDKSIPELLCGDDVTIDCDELTGPELTGFPFPEDLDVIITPIPGTNSFTVSGFDNCTDVTLFFHDEVSSVICNGPFSSIITRTWVATDASGNSSSCTNTVNINNATLDDIVFPSSWDDILGPNPSLDPCDNFPKDENGHPHPEFTGEPLGLFCMNVMVEYTDQRFNVCTDENSYKILRRWVVTDLCLWEQRTHTQTITVMDMRVPIAAAPPEFDVETNVLSCASMIDVPAPIVIFECSEWDYFVSYKLRDESGDIFTFATDEGVIRNPDGTYKITNVPAGQDSVWIIYTIVDACHNITQVFTEAAIIDNEEPVAICKEFTNVAVNEMGEGWATPLSFDNESWDNCGVDYFEVRRMFPSTCTDTLWREKVRFCCEDIGAPVIVELRVYDFSGNSNTCMVEAHVQDNLPPVITCPPNVTVACGTDLSNLSQYGQPVVTDNCGADWEERTIENIGECGEGFITRIFTATDIFGNQRTCTQLITVQNTRPFRRTDITWPRDHMINHGCLDVGTHPDDLPALSRRPIFASIACSEVVASYEDLVFQYVDDVCFKILRTWTVIDWCQFNPFVPTQGVWKHTQVIKVNNTIAPVFVRGCNENDVEVQNVADCQARMIVHAEATDDCTPSNKLIYRWSLDLNNNGIVNMTGNGRLIDRIVEFGTHRIVWTVSDECGNESTCTVLKNIADIKKPTPYCYSQIVTVIMPSTGSVGIWASDFDAGSFDDCTPQDLLRFSFSQDPTDTGRVFTCDDLTSASSIFDLPMFVHDLAGNYDFCMVRLNVQDNNNTCQFNDFEEEDEEEEDEEEDEETRYEISGRIINEMNDPVKDVTVRLLADLPEFPLVQTTSSNGEFLFGDLAESIDFQIKPERNGSYLEGVTTLDIVMIQRHILGADRLGSPYRLIAADVNQDNRISAVDLVALRRLILGLDDRFQNSTSWRFVDPNNGMDNLLDPFPYYQTIDLVDLSYNSTGNDFVMVKVGDVNNTWIGNLSNNEFDSRNTVRWYFPSEYVNAGDVFEIKLSSDELRNVLGFQAVFSFDSARAELLDIRNGHITLDESNVNYTLANKGMLPVSWNLGMPQDLSHSELFSFVFKATASFNTDSFIRILDADMSREIYTLTEEAHIGVETLSLVARTNVDDKLAQFELFQNIPNPFSDQTTIGFNLPEDSDVNLKIFDVSGRLILEKKGRYNKGFNKIDLSTLELTAGMLYYQLETETHSSTRKMIVIK